MTSAFALTAALEGPAPATLPWAAWLIVVSAALKCAQFPFHGWILQVMEAPPGVRPCCTQASSTPVPCW